MLGKLPVPGRPTNMDSSRARAYSACIGGGWGCLDMFTLVYHFPFLSPSLWVTARHRLKYCLRGPLSPKQPTNHPTTFNMKVYCVFSLESPQHTIFIIKKKITLDYLKSAAMGFFPRDLRRSSK